MFCLRYQLSYVLIKSMIITVLHFIVVRIEEGRQKGKNLK